MKRPFCVLLIVPGLIVFLASGLWAMWDVSPSQALYEHAPGETFTVEVALSGDGDTIDAEGFDFHYPSALLQYNGADFSGTLLDAWMYKQVNETTAGNLRVAGFTTSGEINSGTTGTLVKLSFTVKSGASGEDQFTIDGFTDDLNGATTTPATFRVGTTQGVHVAINDTSGTPGQTLFIPIVVEDDVSGMEVLAFDVTVETDTNIVVPVSIRRDETMTASWTNIAFNISGGEINIGGFDVSPLSGQGNLFFIEYQVKQTTTPGLTSNLDIVNFIFNEGDPAVILQDGIFNVNNGITVSGNLHYYNGSKPVAAADVFLDGKQTISGNNGDFVLSLILPGTYSLKPAKIGDLGNSVSPFDAAKVLQYSVGLITLTPMQLIAADVTGNGSVSPFDASQILQLSVHAIDQFPVGKDWTFVPDEVTVTETNWSSVPDSIIYDPLDSDRTEQDFSGIIYGDVTGNWQLLKPRSALLAAKFVVGAAEMKADNYFCVPTRLEISGEAFSGIIALQFNAGDFDFISVESAAEDIIFASQSEGSNVTIACASAKSFDTQTVNFALNFKAKASSQNSSLELDLRELKLDDSVVNAEVFLTEQNTKTLQFQLFQNYPNPFNPETEISYQLPGKSAVEMTIYNLQGQKIKTLISEHQAAGSHRVKWDAKDEQGNEVASGVYLCRLKAGEYVAIRRLLLLR